MDGQTERLSAKLESLLREAAQTAAELQRRQHDPAQPRRYRQIELDAHQVGRQLSCEIQKQAAREVAAEADSEATCPQCGAKCLSATTSRTLTSIDGPVEACESMAYCHRCRRSFFPSA
jgi:uncharacterized protein with PIN domain